MKSEAKNCQNCKKSFQIQLEDFEFYKKIDVPPPTWCPSCRLGRRLAYRNERSLYKSKCGLCEESIISMFSPDKPFTVYCSSCFHSDKWDPMEYGQEYDFNKSFFEQWHELQLKVPQLALLQENSIDSPWVNYEIGDKNCYLNVGGHGNEDSAYNQYALKCRDCFDNFWSMGGQFCYENTLLEQSYKSFFSTLCFECQDTYFSFDCRNCSNIFGCSGLRHKQYHIFNKPVSKEEFDKFLKENSLGSYQNLLRLSKRSSDFWKTQPQRAVFIDRSVNSTGNLVKECKNCQFCWNAEKTEDSKYAFFTLNCKDSYDATSVWEGEMLCELLAGFEKLSNVKFSRGVVHSSSNIEYCDWASNAHNCFGCFSVKSKSYCIFNKEYSPEDFKALRSKIIQHMKDHPYVNTEGHSYSYGEYFPVEFSPFGYNETVAYEYFPITREEAHKRFIPWSDHASSQTHVISGYEIPDDIQSVTDEILSKILECQVSKKPYKIIPMELAFYRRFNLPIPRLAPFERHRKRLAFIASHMSLYDRACGSCKKEIKTVYLPEEFPVVYCEECYLKTIL